MKLEVISVISEFLVRNRQNRSIIVANCYITVSNKCGKYSKMGVIDRISVIWSQITDNTVCYPLSPTDLYQKDHNSKNKIKFWKILFKCI